MTSRAKRSESLPRVGQSVDPRSLVFVGDRRLARGREHGNSVRSRFSSSRLIETRGYGRVGQRNLLSSSSSPVPAVERFCSHATWARTSGYLSVPFSITTYLSASLLIDCLQSLHSITSGMSHSLSRSGSPDSGPDNDCVQVGHLQVAHVVLPPQRVCPR